MTAIAHTTPRHLVSRTVASLRAQVEELADASLWSMAPSETAATLVELTRLTASVAELELRVARHARVAEIGEQAGATSTESWWAHTTCQTRTEAHRKMRLGEALDRFGRVGDAMARGALVPEQALVIVRALEALPADLDVATLVDAEAELVRLARAYDAKQLRVLGRRILDVLDPAAGEQHEARELDREERAAEASVRLTMTDDGQGRVHGRFTLPSAQAAMLKKALLALGSPQHRAAADGTAGARRPGPERLGRAFSTYVERYPLDRVPASGGVCASVVVTMTMETLLGGLQAASLDTGERISAGQARRLACEAGIIPAILGGRSQVLDLGRRRRLHTEPQRIALALEQGGCQAPGCDWPPGMCHAHHRIPWSRGGATSVRNGELLCPRHHTLVHQSDRPPRVDSG